MTIPHTAPDPARRTPEISPARLKLRDDLLEMAIGKANVSRLFVIRDSPAVRACREQQAMLLTAANVVMGFEPE